MAEHDTASVVAGLASEGERKSPLTPAQLVKRFCDESLGGDLVAWAGTRREGDKTTSHGFAGFDGRQGYDDGYDFMGDLMERGWRALPDKGDWPLVVYIAYVRKGGPFAIAEYCEGDLSVWEFETLEGTKAFYATIDGTAA